MPRLNQSLCAYSKFLLQIINLISVSINIIIRMSSLSTAMSLTLHSVSFGRDKSGQIENVPSVCSCLPVRRSVLKISSQLAHFLAACQFSLNKHVIRQRNGGTTNYRKSGGNVTTGRHVLVATLFVTSRSESYVTARDAKWRRSPESRLCSGT